MSEKIRPIFGYENYRVYLKDVYLEGKSKGRKYSFEYYSRILGFSSKSFFKHVIDGKRNLSEESIDKIIAGLKMDAAEGRFFKSLTLLNQATNTQERSRYSAEINKSKAYQTIYPLRASQFRYLTHWYYIPIREMVNLPDFKEDPEWIAKNLLPQITHQQASQALMELLNLGLLIRDQNGKLIQGAAIIATADEVTSAALAQIHREFMRKASESIDLVPREHRDISGVTFRVSAATAKRLKEMIQDFRKELAAVASRDSEPEVVYQLNMQLFPLTQIKPPEGDPK